MELREFNLIDCKGDVMLMIKKGATEYNPVFFLTSTQSFYDAYTFCPVHGAKGQKVLMKQNRENAIALREEWKDKWQPEESVVIEIKQETPTPSPQSTLDLLIAKSVAELSVDKVLEVAKPVINDYITKEFGVLPKKVEVKIPQRETKEVIGVVHKEFDTILQLVANDIPVFLTGPAGCGKNVICKQVAQALGLEFYFSNAVTQEYKLTGFIDANGRYHETQFYKAFTQGGVFMLDEIDASTPEVLVILNAAIANRYFDFPTGRVDAHADFKIVAAGNTFGTGADLEYTGRYQLDASSLDRFALIEVDYDEEVEKNIAKGDMYLVKFIHRLRKQIKAAEIMFTVSYRAIERLVVLKEFLPLERAMQIAITKGMSEDDRIMLSNNMSGSQNPYCQTFCNLK